MSLMTTNEPSPVSEIVNFDKMLNKFKKMISGANSKRIMIIVARDGHGKTSLLRKMHYHCQSQEVPSCLIDLSQIYNFPHLELAREICEGLQLSMTALTEAFSPLSAPVGKSGIKMEASTEIGGNVINSTIETKNILQIVLNNEALQGEDIKRRLSRSFASDISSGKKMMVCLFDTFDNGTRVVTDWLIDALLRPIREGGLNNLIVIIAGSAWPQKINDVEWETHAEFIDRMPLMSRKHLLEFAGRIGCELSQKELETCWLGCGRGKPQLMNMFIKTLCSGKRSSG
jgi:hypothetical protein